MMSYLVEWTSPLPHVNRPPSISLSDAVINDGETYSGNGSFTDSDSISWTATVNYGDGSGVEPLPLNGNNFSLTRSYPRGGTYFVTVQVTDGEGATATSTKTVKVLDYNLTAANPRVVNGDFIIDLHGFPPDNICSWFPSGGHSAYVVDSAGNRNHDFANCSSNGNGDYTISGTPVPADGTYKIEIYQGEQPPFPFDTFSNSFTWAAPVNAAPALQSFSDATIVEGQTYSSNSSFSDADSTSWTANVNYGDGSGEQPLSLSGNNFSLSHTYNEVGAYTITVTVTDNQGATGTETATITVNPNEAPVVANISNSNINQNDTLTTSGTFTDSDSSSWTATVDYGDGAGAVNLPLNTDKTFSLNHQYTVAGTYTVTVVVTDNQSATGTTTATVTVNAPPQISGLSDTEINYQDDFIQSGSFTDSDSTSWTATVDYGDGFGVQPLSLNVDKTFTLDRTYPAVGTYNATVAITDNQGAIGTATITVKVNAPPYISQILGATINEGQSYTENGSFSDPDSASWTGVVNYGDGSGSQPLTLNPDNTFSLSHLYQDNRTYTVIVTITDNQGAIGTKIATVTVNNVAPSVSGITASIDPVQVDTSITASATFTDPGVLDTHTAVWNWGDGTTSNATINSGSISNNHTYTTAGVYVITLTVTDNNGGSTTSTYQYLSVYSPTSQGLFSAGQKYTSPIGAYPQNPNLTGNVKFGLSYKYQGTVPTSHKEFSMDFNQANLHFNATSISSLVISNGIGTLTGAGTINGSSGYDFLVTGSESANTIRIQIKNHQTGVVVYDTQPGAPSTASPTTVVTGNVLAH